MPAEEQFAPSAQDAEQGQKDPQNRMDAISPGEDQPGPSRVPPRQGYCSCCQALYSSVEQHIQSPRHREVVRSARTNVASGSLMERFLLDVIQHHPHRYNDTRPTHADLPSLSSPLVPREALSELCLSEDDGASLGTREDMPSSNDSSCQLVYEQEAEVAPATTTTSQIGEGRKGMSVTEWLTPPSPGQDTRQTPDRESTERVHAPSPDRLHTHSPPPCGQQTPPPVHRKAHRKTNRRRDSSSSSHAPPRFLASPQQDNQPPTMPRDQTPDPKPKTENAAQPPWRRDTNRDQAFSSDHSDPVGDVIEEVIQRHCYSRSPIRHHQGDTDSFHLSLPGSLGRGGSTGDSEDWDTPVQVALGRGRVEGGKDTPGQARGQEGRDLTCLMEVQVNLEDQRYTTQLDSALHSDTRTGGEGGEAGEAVAEGGEAVAEGGEAGAERGEAVGETHREPIVEDTFPALPHIPPSFVGKTLTQVLLEDELKVEAMVREFREGQFLCYFDSESLARYGKRSREKKGRDQNEERVLEAEVFPLAEYDEDDTNPECSNRRKEKQKRIRERSFRQASRCQVVKVSHGTQTTPPVTPVVRQPTLEPMGVSPYGLSPRQDPSAGGDLVVNTPEMRSRLCSLRLPSSYTRLMTPVQSKTSLIYVLSSPETPNTDPKPRLKPGRKRSYETGEGNTGLKVKYRRIPLRYYDPVTNRILRAPPKGLLLAPSSSGLPRPPQPHVVRQLFRSLSPDNNTERQGGEGREARGRQGGGGEGRDDSEGSRKRGRSGGSPASTSLLEPAGPVGVKGQGSSEAGSAVTTPFSRSPLSNGSRFVLGTLAPDSTSNPEVYGLRSRTRGQGQGREGQNVQSGPSNPKKGPTPLYKPQRPVVKSGRRGARKPVTRSTKRGRPPRHTSPPHKSPPRQDPAPTAQPRRRPSRRAAESRKLPRPKARVSPERVPTTPMKQARGTQSRRSSPRHTPCTTKRSVRR